MKKILLLASLSWCLLSSSAENADTVKFQVCYMTQFKTKVGQKDFTSDEMILEVGDKGSCFYARWQRVRSEKLDSLNAIGITNGFEANAKLGDLPRSYFPYRIFNNYPKQGSRWVYCKHYRPLYYEEPLEAQKWEITDADSVVLGYHCTKAKCSFRGHRWTAWFTADIPVSWGPWKLCGLPGLILHASDDSGNCIFDGIELKNVTAAKLYAPPSNCQKCTRQKDQELTKLMFSDVGRYLKLMGLPGGGKVINRDGTLTNMPSNTAILLEDE